MFSELKIGLCVVEIDDGWIVALLAGLVDVNPISELEVGLGVVEAKEFVVEGEELGSETLDEDEDEAEAV